MEFCGWTSPADAVAGVTLASVSEKGSESEIDSLINRAGSELRAKLGVGALSDAQSALVRASLPSNPDAARLYSQGLQNLRLFDALAARESLQKAADLAPDHAPTRSALAAALNILGYEDKAKEQAKKAMQLSPSFSREERLLIEARSHEILEETSAAVDKYRELWEFFPDNVDYGVPLASAQVRAGKPTMPKRLWLICASFHVSEADAARIDLAEGDAASWEGDFKREQLLTDRRRAALASRLAQISWRLSRSNSSCTPWERLGDWQKASERAKQARQLYLSGGDQRGAARCVLGLGDLLFDQGDYTSEVVNSRMRFAEFRKIGAQKSIRAAERIGTSSTRRANFGIR